MNVRKFCIRKFCIIACLSISPSLISIAPVNFFRPYDILLQQPRKPQALFQVDFAYEGSVRSRSFRADDSDALHRFRIEAPTLQLWHSQEDAVAALKGITAQNFFDIPEYFREENDNGEYGRYCINGDFKFHNLMFSGKWHLPRNVSLGLHLPVMIMKLDNITRRRISTVVQPNTIDEDVLSNGDLLLQVLALGKLDWQPWTRVGVGDLALLAYWGHYFPQNKPFLRNVGIHLRVGPTFPTGKKADENILFGIPFGGDGNLGIVFGGILELWFTNAFRFGLDAEFWHIFGSTRERRIRTNVTQTDHLFLARVNAYKQFGITQKFTLYLENTCILPGLSARIAYQFIKHLDDKLFLDSALFSPVIANDAESLQEWSAHNLVISAKYTFLEQSESGWLPYCQFFYKHGFNGKRAVVADTVGFEIGTQF